MPKPSSLLKCNSDQTAVTTNTGENKKKKQINNPTFCVIQTCTHSSYTTQRRRARCLESHYKGVQEAGKLYLVAGPAAIVTAVSSSVRSYLLLQIVKNCRCLKMYLYTYNSS